MSPRREAIVFDLTPDMPFRLTDGTTVNLGELERMVRLARGHRLCAVGPGIADSQTGTGQHLEPRVGAVRRENPRVAQMGARGAARPTASFARRSRRFSPTLNFDDAETDLDEDTARDFLRVAGHAGASRRRGTAAQGHGGAIMTNPRSQTNWQIPRELPDLRRVGIVALDTETKDEGLRADRGSGWPWRDGHVCGISVA